jgi:hypothetical protein
MKNKITLLNTWMVYLLVDLGRMSLRDRSLSFRLQSRGIAAVEFVFLEAIEVHVEPEFSEGHHKVQSTR